MAKKKIQVEEPEEIKIPQEKTDDQAEKKQPEKKDYTIGEWKGRPNYQCKLCPFDTLHEEVIIEHIWQAHYAPPKRPEIEKSLVDRFGNKLK